MVLVVGNCPTLDPSRNCIDIHHYGGNILPSSIQRMVEETLIENIIRRTSNMKGLIGFIVAIFLISLSAGLFYYHHNVTKIEPTNKDSTMTFEPDTTSEDSWEMYKMVLILEQIQNS